MTNEFKDARDVEVIERVAGSSSTDFWGIAHVPSKIEAAVLSAADLERRLDLLRACWAEFDDVAERVVGRAQARVTQRRTQSASRSCATCTAPSRDQMSRKVEVRTPLEVVLTPDGLATHRLAYLDAIRAYNAEGRPARTWPIQFLIRRTAYHVMDHGWELQDRDLFSA